MHSEHEIATLILMGAILVTLVLLRRQLVRTPNWGLLATAFGFYMLKTMATVIEGYLWYDLFNHLEHLFMLLSAAFLSIWIWLVFIRRDT